MFRQWSESFCVALIPNKTGTRPYFQQELAWQSLPFFSARTHRPTRRRDEGHWYDREKLLSTQIAMATCVRQRDFEPDTHHASLGIGTSTEPLERETFVAAAPAPSKTRVAIIDDCDSMVPGFVSTAVRRGTNRISIEKACLFLRRHQEEEQLDVP